jgi:hypothetical protein
VGEFLGGGEHERGIGGVRGWKGWEFRWWRERLRQAGEEEGGATCLAVWTLIEIVLRNGLGVEVGSPIGARICVMGSGSVRKAMNVRGVWQVGQISGKAS